MKQLLQSKLFDLNPSTPALTCISIQTAQKIASKHQEVTENSLALQAVEFHGLSYTCRYKTGPHLL